MRLISQFRMLISNVTITVKTLIDGVEKSIVKNFRLLKMISFFFVTGLLVIFAFNNTSHSFEFEIDEVVTAIKNEINTANKSEAGTPIFKIESVVASLKVVSSKTEKGGLIVNIVGYDKESDNEMSTAYSSHTLTFSFKPNEESNFSPDLSLGLVEPINQIKTALRKAYNSPPIFHMESFTFNLEFAIVKNSDRGISFKVVELNELKQRNINTHRITIHMTIK